MISQKLPILSGIFQCSSVLHVGHFTDCMIRRYHQRPLAIFECIHQEGAFLEIVPKLGWAIGESLSMSFESSFRAWRSLRPSPS